MATTSSMLTINLVAVLVSKDIERGDGEGGYVDLGKVQNHIYDSSKPELWSWLDEDDESVDIDQTGVSTTWQELARVPLHVPDDIAEVQVRLRGVRGGTGTAQVRISDSGGVLHTFTLAASTSTQSADITAAGDIDLIIEASNTNATAATIEALHVTTVDAP